jgi:hypothetical protein
LETYETTIPYIKEQHPPYYLNVPEMLRETAEQLKTWTSTIIPKFTRKDALHLVESERREKGLYLKYTIIRNKWIDPLLEERRKGGIE